MKLTDYARTLLEGVSLEDKTLFPDERIIWDYKQGYQLPKKPGRKDSCQISDKRIKFPKIGSLREKQKKALALNFFANHELLAIEMMAAALLLYPHHDQKTLNFKKGLLNNIKDEQKHFLLYRSRLNDLGYDFGDFPLNDFFWKQMHSLETMVQFNAVMSLTFEAANLDFALYYQKIFSNFNDHKTADILSIVLADEISHVSLGYRYLNLWKKDENLWTFYLENLPWPMTPSRAKGIEFCQDLRFRCGFSDSFVQSLISYQDNFPITNRK